MNRELEVAVTLAEEAGRAVLDLYERGFAVEEKSGGGGPVTDADHAADEILCSGIARHFPDDAVTSEEREDDPRRPTAPRCWLVDPLDGTRHFVDRDGEFAVMVGLAERGEPALGVIHLPVDGITVAGGARTGVFAYARDGERTAVRLEPWSADGQTRPKIASSRDAAGSRTRRAVERLGEYELVLSGSIGRKVALILLGKADAYLTLGVRSHRWDACAADALMIGAGGVFTDATGARLDYLASDMRNARGLVASRAGLDASLLAAASDESGRR